jgi:pimeloyl-ACP methyl ester carboxylesterase
MAKMPPPAPEGDMEAVIAHNVKVFQLTSGPAYPTDQRILREHVIRDMMYYPAGPARQQAAAFVGNFNDRREQLKTIKAPTVVLHGAEDSIVPVAAERDAAANIPGAEFRIVSGMGHDVPVALVPVVADAIAAAASRAYHTESSLSISGRINKSRAKATRCSRRRLLSTIAVRYAL